VIDIERAKQIAIAAVRSKDSANREWVVRDATAYVWGWVITIVNREYADSGDVGTLVPGVGPVAVTADTGRATLLPTSVPPAIAIAEFERQLRSRATSRG
jgi:hypothetical protein